MNRRFAKTWVAVSLGLSLLLLGVDFYAWPRARPGGRSPQAGAETKRVATAEQTPQSEVKVASVVGEVEVRSAGGPWRKLRQGEVLRRGDRIRTGEFSEVVLQDETDNTVAVTPNTEFTIGEKSATVSRFTLGEGRIAADIHRAENRVYEFASAVGDSAADTKEGRFSVVADGRGLLGVVTRAGEVGLTAKGRRVVVPAGKQAVALPGRPPGDPLPIPDRVLLQVKWPGGRTRKDRARISGTTDPGARVKLAGQPVEVRPDGRFETTVPLSEGENSFVVVAEDPAGNTRALRSPRIVRDSGSPTLKIDAGDDIWE
ncbi:MAG: hypothetical protein D6729_15515 [Deltaproteobacteria bacterium]|nr:MAG: hypothetical protein D6729_15515 [Deltaproteobacteria bacterium]